MSSLTPINRNLIPSFLENADPQSASVLISEPNIDSLFANLETLDPAEENALYKEAFEKLNVITDARIQCSSQDYSRRPFHPDIDMYDHVLPFSSNTATYSKGFISGNYMDNGSVAMCGITQNNAARVAEFIFEHEVPIIVRLTAHIQGDINKSLHWIKDSQLGEITCKRDKTIIINILNNSGHVVVKIEKTYFTLTKNDEKHHVIEIYLKDWKDGDIVSPRAVIGAVRVLRGELIALKNNLKNIPYIVHCSAGIGRTGVFFAVKNIMEAMEAGQDPYIPDIILKLRLDRHERMVLNEQQFKLCYDVKKKYRVQLRQQGEPIWKMKV